MEIKEFDYELPKELIAQVPLKKRDASRLLVVNREKEEISHHTFTDILSYLNKGDTLVVNDTKVLPARLLGVKEETGAVIEVLLLKNIEGDTWECLTKPARRVKKGTVISFGDGRLKATCVEEKEEGLRLYSFAYEGIFVEILDALGSMPLPPYIHEKLEDKDRYQTVYAKELGSAAAPTAGLHFTEELLEKVKEKGVNLVSVTLHVGLGTFRPVEEEIVEEHKMHSEYYTMSEEAAFILNETKRRGGRIIAVGTTSTRVLETVRSKYPMFQSCSGWTDIFIYPGYQFKGIDCLITNFHLPKSTLLMLVSALASKELILKAYQEAIEKRYRFFSFGDAMLIE